jgi:hypothetical protein
MLNYDNSVPPSYILFRDKWAHRWPSHEVRRGHNGDLQQTDRQLNYTSLLEGVGRVVTGREAALSHLRCTQIIHFNKLRRSEKWGLSAGRWTGGTYLARCMVCAGTGTLLCELHFRLRCSSVANWPTSLASCILALLSFSSDQPPPLRKLSPTNRSTYPETAVQTHKVWRTFACFELKYYHM